MIFVAQPDQIKKKAEKWGNQNENYTLVEFVSVKGDIKNNKQCKRVRGLSHNTQKTGRRNSEEKSQINTLDTEQASSQREDEQQVFSYYKKYRSERREKNKKRKETRRRLGQKV